MKYGVGLFEAMIAHAISVGRIQEQPVKPLAHVFIGLSVGDVNNGDRRRNGRATPEPRSTGRARLRLRYRLSCVS